MPTSSVFPAKDRPFWNGNTNSTAKTNSQAAQVFEGLLHKTGWRLTSLIAEFLEEKFKLFGVGLSVEKHYFVTRMVGLPGF